MRPSLLLSLSAATLLFSLACGHTAAGGSTINARVDVPERIDEGQLGELRRLYFTLPMNHPSRPELRDAMMAYLDDEVTGLAEADDYDAVVARFAAMTELLQPEDFEAGRLPPRLEGAARYLVERGAPRGDEARVLAGLLVLRLLLEDEQFEAEYTELAQWGVDARATLPNVLERWSKLIDVWHEHARLTPAPQDRAPCRDR